MKYISHRGNISRKNSKEQNAIPYITMALNFGYDVQIDIWCIQDKIFLGHDTPSIEVDYGFISDNKQKLWVHCKNIEALHYFITKSEIRCFFHNNDDAVLTSNGFIWTYPGKTLTEISIAINESDQLLIIDKQTGEYVVYQDSIGKTIFYLYANKMYKSEAENNLSK